MKIASTLIFQLLLVIPFSAEASWFNRPNTGKTTLSNIGGKKATIAHSNTILSNGLVGYWTFDGKDTSWTSDTAGTTRDISGAGNMATGTMTNMVQTTSPVAGKVGQGLGFDGVDDYVTATSTVIGDITTEITAAFWIKTTQTSTTFTNRTVVGDVFHFLPLNYTGSSSSGRCERIVSGVSANLTFTFNNVFNDGKWHHYTCSYSSTNGFRVYKDGVLHASTGASTGVMDTTTNPICFGARCNGGTIDRYWRGSLDDIRFYNRVLSDQEVKLLYDLTR